MIMVKIKVNGKNNNIDDDDDDGYLLWKEL